MAVRVHIYGYLRVLLGKDEITQDWEGGNLLDLLDRMAEGGAPIIREELLDKQGNLEHAYAVFINEERVNELAVAIQDGDDMVITSMLAGG